ncbi:hypothetical protein FLW53_06120 [Microbispora sp. SCL1-1]|jgi:hypothetical protein|uniref:Uncharacterized protein n=1 Tax=Microbispora hainanensis TaxID=568844 RepID=A0ABZ1SR96_9ACTN|nr:MULTISPECIES: hypothetical protein [Microbispora]NJP23785.1 hypothetical protein [Microbispora sp. CL1-1]TQS15319.1 hypothetical protein FLW53_06120 [Microbispora sp. SCL1-1]
MPAETERLRQVVDELFHDRLRVTRRDLYSAAAADIHVPAETLALLNEIPEGSYSRAEMLDAIEGAVRDREEAEREARRPERIVALEDTAEAERAIIGDTTLNALIQGPSGPPPDAPPFREPGE